MTIRATADNSDDLKEALDALAATRDDPPVTLSGREASALLDAMREAAAVLDAVDPKLYRLRRRRDAASSTLKMAMSILTRSTRTASTG